MIEKYQVTGIWRSIIWMKISSAVCEEQEKNDQIREDMIRNVAAVWDDQCEFLIHNTI